MRYRLKVELFDEAENRVWVDYTTEYLEPGTPLRHVRYALSKLWESAFAEIRNRLT